jgi:hypothetical protein
MKPIGDIIKLVPTADDTVKLPTMRNMQRWNTS